MSERSSFLFKIRYHRNGKLYLACIFFVFNCSKLEEEEKEKKNNGKEGKDKAKPEKVKREAAQVTVLDIRIT